MNIVKEISRNCLKRKSLKEASLLDTKLSRCLTVPLLFFYAVSSMTGAGIYILAGHIIKNKSGSSANLSFIIGGISAFFAGLCYAELGTLMPKAGSCYTYTYVLIGELPAFIIGWIEIMDHIIALASIAKSFSSVLNLATGGIISNFTDSHLPLFKNSAIFDSSFDIVAGTLILLLCLVTISGTLLSFSANLFLQSIQILCLSLVTIGFFIYGNPTNYLSDGGYAPFGVVGVIEGASLAIFAVSGLQYVTNCAEEVKNPKKSIPLAMFLSLAFVMVLYVSVVSGLSYMVPRLQINVKAPFLSAFENKGLEPFKWISIVGALIATGASKLSLSFLIGRCIYAVSRDGLLFQALGQVNETTKVPIRAVLVGCSLSLVLAVFSKIQILAELTTMGIIISFIFVGIDLIILRYVFEKKENENLKTRQPIKQHLRYPKFFIIIFISFLASIFLLEISSIFLVKIHWQLGVLIISITFLLSISLFAMLCLYEPDKQNDTFQTPFMPVAPVLTIVINIGLLLSLPGATWIRFIVWLIIGIILYCGYGIFKYKTKFLQEDDFLIKEDQPKRYDELKMKN